MKPYQLQPARPFYVSLPTWERELKPLKYKGVPFWCQSLPTWERELKRNGGDRAKLKNESLPTWERELKPVLLTFRRKLIYIAPYVGA